MTVSTYHQAKGLLEHMQSFTFIFLLHLFSSLLELTSVTSDALSSKALDLRVMMNLIDGLQNTVHQDRSDINYEQC